MPTISFTVLGRPIPKGRTTYWQGRRLTPKRTRDAEEDVAMQALPYKPKKPITGAVELKATFYMPIPESWSKRKKESAKDSCHISRPDSDNLGKTLLDALKSFWIDDSQICSLEIKKVYGEPTRTEVEITYLESSS